MAERSYVLRQLQAGLRAQIKNAIIGNATITLVDGGAGVDTIVDSANGLGDFSKGDMITLSGCTTAANDGEYEIISVAAGVIEIPTDSVDTPEATLATTILASARGGSLADIFRNCYINIYSGSIPASPNVPATGTLIGTISLNAGAFTAGTETNGLNFERLGDVDTTVYLQKDASEAWQMECLSTNTPAYFRLMANTTLPSETGVSAIAIDGAVHATTGDMRITETLVVGTTYDFDGFIMALLP